MIVDDLAAPLGQGPKRRPRTIKIRLAQVIIAALALFLGVFVVWAVVGDDPFGGQPRVIVPAHPQVAIKLPPPPSQATDATGAIQNGQPAAATPSSQPVGAAANTMTVTIIDGKTGTKQEFTVPSRGAAAAAATGSTGPGLHQKLFETTAYGLIPKIADDGTRPADAFAQPAHPLAGRPEAPRIAIVVGGMGASAPSPPMRSASCRLR
jgi:uncharacterized protein